MESAEEDSYVELGTIIRSIRDADLHAHVHEKAAIFHRNAMEDAKVSAATAQQLSKTQRQLYRETVAKFAGIFAAATDVSGDAHEARALQGEDKLRRDSATLSNPVRMSSTTTTDVFLQEAPSRSVEGHRRESSDLRVDEWRMQASAVSVADEDERYISAMFGPTYPSKPGTMRGPPPSYASPLRPPFASPLQPLPPTPSRVGRIPFSASCNNLAGGLTVKSDAIRITDASGNPIHFKHPPTSRISMHSAPEMTTKRSEDVPPVPSIPAKYETHAMRSQAASKQAYEILAGQIRRREEGERRQWEQVEGSEETQEVSQAGSEAFL